MSDGGAVVGGALVGGFPGGTAVSRLSVYDWPTADGLRGGSPHLHTASTEGYVVLGGVGSLQTLSSEGYVEHPLSPGVVLWFTPGTVHRLVSAGDLEILVVMQNAGLPEAGDAVLTFPSKILGDPEAYVRAASLPPRAYQTPAAVPAVADIGAGPAPEQQEDPLAAAARRRRDLAIEGYLELRERVRAEGPSALNELHRQAAELVRQRAARWRDIWRSGPLAQAERTGRHLAQLGDGDPDHLADAVVRHAIAAPSPLTYGMCGRLQTWDVG